jgi:hypothetical protein
MVMSVRSGWKKVLTQVERGLWGLVKARCFREGTTVSEGVNAALREWVESEEGSRRPSVEPKRGEWF